MDIFLIVALAAIIVLQTATLYILTKILGKIAEIIDRGDPPPEDEPETNSGPPVR